ncbi:MAG: PilZ domain-containing protein [Phycisphaerales bacterium JB063]
MTQPLRLATDANEHSDSLFFERRRAARRRASGKVTAVYQATTDADGPQRLITLQLNDLSDTGVGVTAPEPISVGSKITLFFPPHGNEPGFDLSGSVVRCHSVDDKHRLGIALNMAGTKMAG